MMKSIAALLAGTILITSAQAGISKETGYEIINYCKFTLEDGGKYDETMQGLLLGMGQAYTTILRKNNIDNEYASLSPAQYADKMCQIALWYREDQNKKTGGKYDVTQFYYDLIDIGYHMTLPPKNGTDTKTKKP